MLDFMVLSAPRSGSTWAANWLNTGNVHCLHDPILEYRVPELDALTKGGKGHILGVACTALALAAGYVSQHPCPKLVIHRDFTAINTSLVKIGLTPLASIWDTALDGIVAKHINYLELFDTDRARDIWCHLMPYHGHLFDAGRHQRLAKMRVEPQHSDVVVKPDCARDFRNRIERAFQ